MVLCLIRGSFFLKGDWMKRLAVVALSVVALSSYGAAQVTKPLGLSVRAGILWPTSDYGRDVGRTWFGIGADYKIMDLPNASEELTSRLSISIDYYGKGEASAVPVLLNYTGTTKEGFYFTGGIGFSFTNDKSDSFGTGGGTGGGGTSTPPSLGGGGGTATSGRTTKTNFAYTLGLGYNFPNSVTPVFVEGRFFGSSRTAMNAFGLYVGVRF